VLTQLRRLVPIAVAAAAVLDTLSAGGVAWLVAPLVLAVALVAVHRSSGRGAPAGAPESGAPEPEPPKPGPLPARPGPSAAPLSPLVWNVLIEAGAFAALAVVLALPAVTTASAFVPTGGNSVFTAGNEWGNLIQGHPVNLLQGFGIWPTGDFRFDPSDLTTTRVLIAVTALAGLVGLWWSVRRRNWGLLGYLAAAIFAVIVFQAFGSPWVAGKGLAGASPALVAAGMVGAAAIWSSGRQVEATVVAGAITAGVLWSNFLGYQDVNLGPRARLAELAAIDHRFAGQGPTLMTEYEPFGARHFLHDMDPEGASELRRRAIPLTDGTLLPKGGSADLDRFALPGLLVYRTLVIRRSPAESRPPSVYRLAWPGRYYDVWQRPAAGGTPIISHLALGDAEQSGAVPSCADVLRLARGPGVARLAAPLSSVNAIFDPTQGPHPDSWTTQGSAGMGSVVPLGPGMAQAAVPLAAGRYSVFIRGAFRPDLTVRIDGRSVARLRDELTHSNDDYPLAQVTLGPGSHQIALTLGDVDLHPGSGGMPFPVGPLLLGTGGDDRPIVYVAPGAARSLCGRRLDWVESLGA
jgi:hypothetical protein